MFPNRKSIVGVSRWVWKAYSRSMRASRRWTEEGGWNENARWIVELHTL